MFARRDAQQAIDLAAEVSRTTQQAPLVLDLCRLWAALLVDALSGVAKDTLVAFSGPALTLLRQRALKPALRGLLEGYPDTQVLPGSDALAATRTALASFANAATLREALLHAEAHARGVSSTIALCGALAGAHYGAQAIPPQWRQLTD